MVLRLHFLSIGHSAGSPIRVFTAIAGKSFQIPYTTPNGDSIGPFFFFFFFDNRESTMTVRHLSQLFVKKNMSDMGPFIYPTLKYRRGSNSGPAGSLP